MDKGIKAYLAAGNTVLSNYLLQHYHELGMNNDEFIVFLQLKSFADQRNNFPNLAQIARITGMAEDQLYQTIQQLIDQKLLSITSTTDTEGRTHDAYNFDLLNEKLLKLSDQQVTVSAEVTQQHSRSDSFKQIETEFGRPLSPIEMQTINAWLDEEHYTPEVIYLALREAVLNQSYSLKYMDKILLSWERKHLTTATQVQNELDRFNAKNEHPIVNDNHSSSEKKPPIPNFKIGG